MSRQYDAGGGKMDYSMYILVSRLALDDGVLEDKKNLSQNDNLRAVIFQGMPVTVRPADRR